MGLRGRRDAEEGRNRYGDTGQRQAKEKVNEYPQRTFRHLLRRVPDFEQGMDDGDRLRPVGDVEEDRGDEDFPGVGCEGLWM